MLKSELEVGDYVEYRYRDIKKHKEYKARGYIIVFRKFGPSEDIAWIGEKKGTDRQQMESIFMTDILRKMPPSFG